MKKLQEKINRIKDQYVVDSFNLAQRAMNEIILIQKEVKELNKKVKKGEN